MCIYFQVILLVVQFVQEYMMKCNPAQKTCAYSAAKLLLVLVG